jgi:hypothetical protein
MQGASVTQRTAMQEVVGGRDRYEVDDRVQSHEDAGAGEPAWGALGREFAVALWGCAVCEAEKRIVVVKAKWNLNGYFT